MGDDMLKKKALRKILVTTFTVFVLMVVYLIPSIKTDKSIKPDYNIQYVNSLETSAVYLLSNYNYLMKTHLLAPGDKVIDKAKNILNRLTVLENSNLLSGSRAIIPEQTKVLNLVYKDKIIEVNFSKEFLSVDAYLEERMLEAIIYSLTAIDNVKGVKIMVEGVPLVELPHSHKKLESILTRQFGINKVYEIESTEDINKVIVYFLETGSNSNYYVPVTRYVNDGRDKIQIVIDSLSSNYIYQPSLTSFLNADAKLLKFEVAEGLMILDFNENIFDKNSQILEEVLYTISYSVFDNYEVNEVMFRVGGKEVFKKLKKDIE